ncbi:uncharacterized protein LOC130674963 [Microplitis mediator]|uniref:uncharacterized protein LOC130674963 n=1 Tax=Microplitis mediator TaxID=375433 RepID=UPI0025527449|nr:uncharacterized protein LOC130674963 [Microplitis mediator]
MAEFRAMHYAVLLCFIVKIVQSGHVPVNSLINNPVVQVEHGRLQGIRVSNIDKKNYYYAFRGIPYAKPPLGELRFKDSEPAEPWSGLKDATKFGNVCAQKDFFTRRTLGNEDCLFLNVYTSDLKPDAPRAVMVWIHGGAFFFGSGNDDIYGPDYLVEKDVVVVTMNYRLGMIGFLNLEDEAAPGNQGLKDQVLALKWVQKNIEKFGGDPNRVTIFGESAGSASVHYLTLSPLAQGLFQKAILQSGVATNTWASAPSSMKEAAENVSEKLGNKVTDTKKLIEFLQSVDALKLAEAEDPLKTWTNFYETVNPFTPSVDSKAKNPFLNIPLTEAIKSGIKVPHIIGYNSDEGIIFITGLEDDEYSKIDANRDTLLVHPTEERFLKQKNVSSSDVTKFFIGDRAINRENAKYFADLLSARFFLINIHNILEIQSSIADAPTYLYKFDFYSKETSILQKILATDLQGTCHAEDLFFIFYPKMLKLLELKPPASDTTEYIIQERFLELWTNFAKTGNPNRGTSELIPIEWPPVDDPTEWKCLKISTDLSLIKESNILDRISNSPQKNVLNMEPKFGTVIYAILLNFLVEIVVSSDGSLANYLKIKRPIVEVEHSQVKGVRNKNVDGFHYFNAFRGIPYAKPLIGELRFQNNYADKIPFVPSIDSKLKNPFLEIPIKEAIKSGIKVPNILGHNSQESISSLAGTVRSSDDLSDKSETNRPIVQVHDGQLKGIKEKNVNGQSYFYAFRGIPFAKPPVDELRFKDPEQVEPWSDVRDAKDFGDVCIQFDWNTKKIEGKEDCLYLNVYTPEIESSKLRAVMVWIFGGGFEYGSGNDDLYGPDYLVEKDVVLVTINYRVGIFGFLNLDDEAAPGNQGLKDQVMALKWVQQNIDKFGGDPNLVTIFGESAGAASVHYLTLSPLSQGLFSKAILQSGVATDPWASASGSMKAEAERLADKLGNKSNDTRELIEYFRSVDPQEILEAVQSLQSWKNYYLIKLPYVPSVDSKSKNPFMNISIAQAAESGIRVPHIIGYNSQEGIFVLYDLDDDQYSEIESKQETLLLSPNERTFLNRRNLSVSDVKNFFMGNNSISRENAQQLVNLTSAARLIINIQDVLDIQSSIPDVKTYFYKFDYYSKDTSITQQLYDTDLKGTSHVEDVFYLFSSKTLEAQNIDPPTSNPVGNVVKQRFVELWTNFAKTGNPNSGESELIPIEWQPNNSPTEYTCLEISEDLKLIKEPNILNKISKNIQNKQ